jgi:hypothetical protein
MRFFKSSEGSRSAEDDAAYARLTAIADRSKVRDTIDFGATAPNESQNHQEAPDSSQ